MTVAIPRLDKSFEAAVEEGYGTITIRVVVLDKKGDELGPTADGSEVPIDAAPDEMLPELDTKKAVAGFLEEPKRGKYVCVFLINGQRQHVWDNQFISRDLSFKYLRNHMLVIVDCDGLRPEAIAELIQGSRHQFYEGSVYAALEARVISTLKEDPDLKRLHEEAEDEIANLGAGDEAVKLALDQLIESHHEAASHVDAGAGQPGVSARNESTPGGLVQTQDVVVESESPIGADATDPVLQLRPEVPTIRLKPNDERSFSIHSRPDGAWKAVGQVAFVFDPPVKELQVTRSNLPNGEKVSLKFVEPEQFDDDEYPIEATLRVTATFAGFREPRLLERRVVITPPRKTPPPPPRPLLDDPTSLKVSSRQPIKIVAGGADVHVKLRWDGKDELAAGPAPEWTFQVSCETDAVIPTTFLTKPVEGRFELLIQASHQLKAGDQLNFVVEAIGPNKTLSTAFLANVVEPVTPRRTTLRVQGGAQRRPPYLLRYLDRKDWPQLSVSAFGQPWSGTEPGSFEPPSASSPLTILINNDTDLWTTFREGLVARKLAESTISQRKVRYATHVAFHLYQMYEKQAKPSDETEKPNEAQMREEIQRVAKTLVKLMEVVQA